MPIIWPMVCTELCKHSHSLNAIRIYGNDIFDQDQKKIVWYGQKLPSY